MNTYFQKDEYLQSFKQVITNWQIKLVITALYNSLQFGIECLEEDGQPSEKSEDLFAKLMKSVQRGSTL